MSKRLDTTKVIEYVKKKKRFTTMDIARQFKVSKMQGAAAVSIMRIKEIVEADTPAKTEDGVSRWVYTG